MHAADLIVTILENKEIGGNPVFHFRGQLFTTPFFSVIHKVKQVIESFCDMKGLFSYRFQVHGDDGSTEEENVEFYDYEKKKTIDYTKATKDHQTKTTKNEYADLQNFSQDLLSISYFLRTIDFDKTPTTNLPVVNGHLNTHIPYKIRLRLVFSVVLSSLDSV